ncbi:MAG: LacI family DNA-binding transcriptional regulator [Acidimicrobiales bacterium]
MATIIDVAEAAGVSTATVSRVLNNNPRVDPVMAVRVRRAIADLGYRPSRAARTLRTQQSRVWTLVIPDVRNPFFTEMVRGIEDVAYGAGYALILCNSDEDGTKEHAYLELALAEQVSGIVLAPTHPPVSSLRDVLAQAVPIVTVDRKLEGYDLDHVVVNNAAGAEQAVEHLLAGGYRRIACINGPLDTTTGWERLVGFRRGLERQGIAPDEELIRLADFREAGGRREMEHLLALDEPPDAVLVGNNLMTLGALEAIFQSGLEIPRDIALVGFDDSSWNALARPPLTSIAQPTYELGLETARLLLNRIEGYTGPAREVMLSPVLKVRGSTTARAAGFATFETTQLKETRDGVRQPARRGDRSKRGYRSGAQ